MPCCCYCCGGCCTCCFCGGSCCTCGPGCFCSCQTQGMCCPSSSVSGAPAGCVNYCGGQVLTAPQTCVPNQTGSICPIPTCPSQYPCPFDPKSPYYCAQKYGCCKCNCPYICPCTGEPVGSNLCNPFGTTPNQSHGSGTAPGSGSGGGSSGGGGGKSSPQQQRNRPNTVVSRAVPCNQSGNLLSSFLASFEGAKAGSQVGRAGLLTGAGGSSLSTYLCPTTGKVVRRQVTGTSAPTSSNVMLLAGIAAIVIVFVMSGKE